MSRSAVKVSKSLSVFATQQDKRAQDLEAQLTALGNSSNGDNKANGLRTQLCEVLCDLILTDPGYSCKHDICGRLWRKCFYERIGPLRSRIMREKRKNRPTGKLDQSLSFFLTETLTLYCYLCDKLQSNLLKAITGAAESSQQEDATTTTSGTDTSAPSPSSSTKGVVECLHHIYVHLGDLYRYSENLEKAEGAYQRSSRLGPGHGNPYNQLAVLCQLQGELDNPLSAVVLYWYARSLLASHDVFVTSQSNLTRLFSSNKDWLDKQRKNKEQGQATASGNKMLSRLLLAQFVDMHAHLFRGVCAEDADGVLRVLAEVDDSFRSLLKSSSVGDSLVCKMVVILAFGECWHEQNCDERKDEIIDVAALQRQTCTISRIMTLTLGTALAERVLHVQQSPKSSTAPTAANWRLLAPLLLLTEYLLHKDIVPGKCEQLEDGSSMRLVEATNKFWATMVKIWNVTKGNPQLSVEASDPRIVRDFCSVIKEYSSLRGFAPFSSFLPVLENGFVTDTEAVRVLELEAKSTPPANGGSVSTANTTGSQSSPSASEQGRIKIGRLLWLASELASSECDGDSENDPMDIGSLSGCQLSKHVERQSSEYVWVPVSSGKLGDADVVMTDNLDAARSFGSTQGAEASGLTLVYQQDASGGPALLVPGCLLAAEPAKAGGSALSQGGSRFPSDERRDDSNHSPKPTGVVEDTTMQSLGLMPATRPKNGTLHKDGPSLPTLTGNGLPGAKGQLPLGCSAQLDPAQAPPNDAGALLPPPGFGPSRVGGTPAAGQSSAQAETTSLPIPGLGVYPSTVHPSTTKPQMTVMESFHLFSGSQQVETKNPFVSPAFAAGPEMAPQMRAATGGMMGSGIAFASPALSARSREEALWMQDAIGPDGAALLDSSLLSSLISSDEANQKRTKNPFAAM